MLIFFVVLILLICLFWLGYILLRRLPDVKNLDINSLTQEKRGQTRAKILEAKLLRTTAKPRQAVAKLLAGQRDFFSARLDRLKRRVSHLEASYQPAPEVETISPQQLIETAKELMVRDDFSEAEKKLIEVIAQDQKNVTAYEVLGDLYFQNKNYDQAEEVFKYLIKLHVLADKDAAQIKKGGWEEVETELLSGLEIDPKVAGYYDELGQVYAISGKEDKALDTYLKASSVEPNNPKYLDKIIDLALLVKDKGLAKKAHSRLKAINPENAKLDELREAIEKME